MVNYTLGDLIHDSFRVTHGMIAVFPQTGHEVTLSVVSSREVQWPLFGK